ncbi:MAG: ATP-binding cassette domain-containing protein [Acidobacteriota bacterium]
MSADRPVCIVDLTRRFRQRTALDALCLDINAGELFGFLGPNGSGKSTLFRILATLLPPSSGSASIWGLDVVSDAEAIRHRLGVVFQSPALDDMLTVRENLMHQGHLYGRHGQTLRRRVQDLMERFHVADRRDDRVGTLSGGLQRRVDLARGILHEPDVLLLDEPSTGLDPGARRDLWNELAHLRQETGLTILVTTHLMAEGERCDRVAILDQGHLVALAPPATLRQELGGSVVIVRTTNPEEFRRQVRTRFDLEARVLDGSVRIEHTDGHGLVPRLAAAFPEQITSLTVQAPTLEDVFAHRTGRTFDAAASDLPG